MPGIYNKSCPVVRTARDIFWGVRAPDCRSLQLRGRVSECSHEVYTAALAPHKLRIVRFRQACRKLIPYADKLGSSHASRASLCSSLPMETRFSGLSIGETGLPTNIAGTDGGGIRGCLPTHAVPPILRPLKKHSQDREPSPVSLVRSAGLGHGLRGWSPNVHLQKRLHLRGLSRT